MDLSPDCERVRRLHPDGVPAGLGDIHRVRDPPGGAGRRSAAPVCHQAGRGARAGSPASGARGDRDAAGVPAGPGGAHEAAPLLAFRRHPRVPAGAAPLHAPPSTGRGARRADRAGPVTARPSHAAVGSPEDLRQGTRTSGHARRPSAERAGRPPPARALRARHDDHHLARGVHHRAAVLVHRPRARHLRAGAQPEGLAAPQAAGRALRRHVHRGERPPPAGDRARRRRPPRLPRAVRGLHADAGLAATSRPSATAACACSASGGSWPRRAST